MDFKLFEQGSFFDFEIGEGGYVTEDFELRTAVLLSIFTDRRAEDDDPIEDSKRGWWGDTYHNAKIGSRLWTLRRRKATTEVLILAKEIVEQSLQWLIDDDIIGDVVVRNAWSTITLGRMNLSVDVIGKDGRKVNFRFDKQLGES